MNLTIDPWIPVTWKDGRSSDVSLCDVFVKGEGIADLAGRPPERIALMRLLLCIVHAALDGPRDVTDWEDCYKRIPEAAVSYLQKWRYAFELFGDGPRFLQVEKLESIRNDDEGNAVDKLDLSLACGNNSTLFDNDGGSERRFTEEQLALMLLTFQSFHPGGLIGIARWNGRPTGASRSATAAVCVAGSPLHAFLRKDTLLQTLHANLISQEMFQQRAGRNGTWGCPVWEKMPKKPGDLTGSARTYLGRLVPIARAIRLNDDCRTAIVAEGLRYPVFDEVFAESTATIVLHEKNGKRLLMRADPARAIWRQLAAITVLRRSEDTIGGPLALLNLGNEEVFDLWLGGLATNKAKLVDTVESVFNEVPSAMVQENGQKVYGEGVSFAEGLASRIGSAIARYRRELKDEIEGKENRDRRFTLKGRATLHYWTVAEGLVPELFKLVQEPPVINNKYHFQNTAWGKRLFLAALEAYDLACPHETARQLQAYVLGRAVLAGSPDTVDTDTVQESQEEEKEEVLQ